MSKTAVIQELESAQLKKDIPEFRIGDTLRVHLRIIEGDKERVQVFTGTVIARKGSGLSETITLHRVAYGCSMERLFLLHSPKIAKIEVTRQGKVRQAKLYYLRGTLGKKAKVKEFIGTRASSQKEQVVVAPQKEEEKAPQNTESSSENASNE